MSEISGQKSAKTQLSRFDNSQNVKMTVQHDRGVLFPCKTFPFREFPKHRKKPTFDVKSCALALTSSIARQ
jgi:hypothetical protein